jgi:hypothetical protein
MFKAPGFAVILVSAYIMIYFICLSFDSLLKLAGILFYLFPLVLFLLVFLAIRYGLYQEPEADNVELGHTHSEMF